MSRMRSYKRLFGTVVAGLVVVALVVAAVLQLQGRRRLAKAIPTFEAAVGPLDLSHYEPSKLAAVDNAATWLERGANAFVWSDAERNLVNALLERDHPPSRWSEDQVRDLSAFLERSAPAFALMQSALARPVTSHVAAYKVESASLLPFVKAARALWVQGRLALSRGDWATVTTNAAVLGKLAGSLEQEPTAIHVLIGIALEKFQLALLRDALEAGADAPTLRRLVAFVPTNDLTAGISHSLASEAAAGLAVIEGRLPADHFLAGLADERRGVMGALVHALTSRLAAADAMEMIAKLRPRATEPTAILEAELPRFSPFVPDSGQLRSNMIALHGRAAAMARMRALALVATSMRITRLETGAYPDAIGDSGEPAIVTSATDGGGLRPELHGAAERWPSIAGFQPGESLLSWELPR